MTNLTQIDTANELIESKLVDLLGEIASGFTADVITFRGGLSYGVDDLIRNAVEEMPGARKAGLLMILETDGGSIDVAERIAKLLRKHYGLVDFLVPNFAFSAGTILAMSGDNIWMDYYSVLGPIDPQVRKDGVGWVPALGYLHRYEQLIKKSAQGTITQAEVAFLCERFDPAELHAFEQAKEQSITILKQWLVNYKFKDWTTTDGRKLQVTQQMKEDRAAEIAEKLNKTDLWHSHSRGITMDALRDPAVLNLKINDFSEKKPAGQSVRSYYKLLRDYMLRRGYDGIVHTVHKLTPL